MLRINRECTVLYDRATNHFSSEQTIYRHPVSSRKKRTVPEAGGAEEPPRSHQPNGTGFTPLQRPSTMTIIGRNGRRRVQHHNSDNIILYLSGYTCPASAKRGAVRCTKSLGRGGKEVFFLALPLRVTSCCRKESREVHRPGVGRLAQVHF